MLEFLMLLSARFHSEIYVEGADLAREALSDPTIDVAATLDDIRTFLAHVTHTWGVVEGGNGYLIAAPCDWSPVGPPARWLV